MSTFIAEDDELFLNTSARVPVCLCIDLSGSMLAMTDFSNAVDTGRTEIIDGKTCTIWEGGICRLDELNEGLVSLYKIIQDDETASNAVELAIVGFRDQPVLLQDFKCIDIDEPFNVGYDMIGDMTDMDAGVHMALDLLEQRKEAYKASGRDYYQPWLIILSDAEVDPNKLTSQARTIALEANDKLVVSSFIVGNKNEGAEDALRGFSNNIKPKRVQNGSLELLFKWIGKSVVKVSRSKPGDKVPYSAEEFDQLFDID